MPLSTRERMLGMIADVGAFYQERDEIARVLTVAFVAEANALLVGPPGTAKSHVVRSMVSHVSGAKFCDLLLTPFTTLDELAGPPRISALRDRDVFERNHEGTAADCHVFFPDETFRGSSAALNGLLTMINEHTIGGVPIPMRLAVGATNMLPSDEGLDAIDDRFLLRMFVGDLEKDSSFDSLLANAADPARRKYVPNSAHTFGLDDWKLATEESSKILLPKTVRDLMRTLDAKCKADHIRVSPRRWSSLVRVLQAAAWLDGCVQVEPDHLDILRHGLWRKDDERSRIHTLIDTLDAGDVKWISDQADMVLREIKAWSSMGPQDKARKASDITQTRETAIAAITAKLSGVGVRAKDIAKKKLEEIDLGYKPVRAELRRQIGLPPEP